MIGFRDIVVAAETHALELGRFDQVGRHEPAGAPGLGVAAAIWVDKVEPDRRMTGLAATSVVVVLNIRVTLPLTRDPADDVDVILMDAVDDLMAVYSAGFTFGGLVSSVDLLGRSGVERLRAEMGYLDEGSQTFRACVVFVPCVIEDAWVQSA